MQEIGFDGSQEKKEKPKRLVVEIGADKKNSYLKLYGVELPPGTVYQIVSVDYGILPNEETTVKPIPLADASVDEIVLSNVLGDLPYFNFGDKKRFAVFWECRTISEPSENMEYERIQFDVSYFQKMRIIKDIFRVLKTGGFLKIYENYKQFRPDVVAKVLEWLQTYPGVEFGEDSEEERRIQPILDKENQRQIYFGKRHLYHNPDELMFPIKQNKVYIVKKKPPQE